MSDYGPNRYLCAVLEEMRDILKQTNIFTYKRSKKVLSIMIEEIQMHANIMESSLGDVVDIEKLLKERRKLKKDVKKLKNKITKLKEKLPGDNDDNF